MRAPVTSDFSKIVKKAKKFPKAKKVKKIPISKLQKLLWEECKRIIRNTYVRKDGTWECYTCGKIIEDKQNAHTAHFIAKSVCGAFLKYELRNLRICCMMCNVWLGGNGSMYYRHMVEREGQEYVDLLFKEQQKIIKAYDHYEMLLAKYKLM